MNILWGLDLGQSQDYSALIMAERHQDAPLTGVRGSPRPPARYAVRVIHRWPLGTPYPQVVDDVYRFYDHPEVRGQRQEVILDFTGVGRPVANMFTRPDFRPRHVHIHGGVPVTRDEGQWGAPKRDLVGTVQVLLQQSRLKFAADAPELPALLQELRTFRQRIDPQTAHVSYSHWREQDHDDLVIALALACWWGEEFGPKQARMVPYG